MPRAPWLTPFSTQPTSGSPSSDSSWIPSRIWFFDAQSWRMVISAQSARRDSSEASASREQGGVSRMS